MRTAKLTNLQLELLKLYSYDLKGKQLLEIKNLLAKYFADKAISEANKVWDKKGWTEKDAEQMLKKHKRTPYRKRVNA